MTGRRLALIGAVSLLATFAPSVLASPPQADQTSYDIALVSERDDQRGIYVMRGDGSQGTLLLAERNVILLSSSWSPDGKKIAYFRFHAEDEELYKRYDLPFHFALYVMNPDGSDRERLLDVPVTEFAWSPDSQRLVFSSGHEDPARDNPRVQANLEALSAAIYVLDLQNRTTRRLTSLGDNRFASWSPDGRRIVFSGGDTGAANRDIYIFFAGHGDEGDAGRQRAA